MNIIVSGPQGSGKGTQAELLTQRKGYFHMESGKLLREIAKTDPRIADIMYVKGELVPSGETIKYIEDHITDKWQKFDSIIFDGFPRNLDQYQDLVSWLKSKGSSIDLLLYFYISEEETIKRLSARRTCEKCGRVYNLITNPPPGDLCECGGNLIQREDDKPQTIKKRLDVFHSQTKPMLEFVKQEGKVVEVNGEKPIEEIYQEVEEIINKKS